MLPNIWQHVAITESGSLVLKYSLLLKLKK